MRVIALPHAGGWPSAFARWATVLAPQVELRVAQLPGRGGLLHSDPLPTLPTLASGLAEALAPHLEVPYVLVGHSFGSVLAFEVARELRRTGRRLPAALLASARQAPHLPSCPPFVHHKSDAALHAYLERLGGLPPAIIEREELLQLVLRTVRADFQALESYRYKVEGPFTFPLLIAGALDDPVVPPEVLYPWALHTCDATKMVWLEGGHFYLYHRNNAARLLVQLMNCLGLTHAHA